MNIPVRKPHETDHFASIVALIYGMTASSHAQAGFMGFKVDPALTGNTDAADEASPVQASERPEAAGEGATRPALDSSPQLASQAVENLDIATVASFPAESRFLNAANDAFLDLEPQGLYIPAELVGSGLVEDSEGANSQELVSGEIAMSLMPGLTAPEDLPLLASPEFESIMLPMVGLPLGNIGQPIATLFPTAPIIESSALAN